jgi:hypothetical protein
VRSFSIAERRARLARRHFLSRDALSAVPQAPDGPPVVAVTGALIGWHATDPATPYLSLWARLSGFAVGDLDREMYDSRSLVKHLAMRRTLWLFDARHLPVVQPAASDRVADNERRRLIADVEKAGVTADGQRWLDDACAAVLKYLSDNSEAGSAQLRAALAQLAGTYNPAPGKSWGGEVPLAPRVLTVLAVRGDIVRGPNDGGWTTSRPRWATTAGWLGAPADRMPVQSARADLTRRWLRAFGPATLDDIKWWFGTTVTAVRQALRDIDAVEVDLDGVPGYALPDDLDAEPEPEPWAALLPGLDVTTMGWFHRDWYLGEHRGDVFDRNGNGGPTAWWNGRVVGGWCQDADGRVQLQLLEDPGREGRRALQRRAGELTGWLDGTRISPRFPSQLSKAGPAAKR